MNLHNLNHYIENKFIKDIYYYKDNEKIFITDIVGIEKPCEIFASIRVSDKLIELLIKIDNSFPYNLPSIKINNLDVFDDYKQKYGIYPPHITPKGSICIGDREEIVINFENPNGVLGFAINCAASIIFDGYNELNTNEFIDEFDVHLSNIAYKNNRFNRKIYLLERCKNFKDRLFLSRINSPMVDGFNLSSSKELNELNFKLRFPLKNINYDIKEKVDTERVLYLDLKSPLTFPLPKTNGEIFSFIRDYNSHLLKKYYEHLKWKEDKDAIVIFSMNDTKGEKIFFAIKHKKPSAIGKNSKYGYRFSSNKKDLLTYKSIYRLDQNKIESRVEGLLTFNKSVSIVGCGSVGSILADALLDMGIKDFYLIDDEYLESENIVRHIGDINDLKLQKAFVVQKYLLNKKPYINVKTFECDIHGILNYSELYKNILNKRDINFFVTGNKSVNNRILNMINNRSIVGTTILVWVESYLYAGHFLIINNEVDLDYLYDKENKFNFRVITDKRTFTRQEAGCAGSYSIYSAFDTKRFVYNTLNYIKDNIEENRLYTENILITWTSNLAKARKEGIELSNEYTMKMGNSIKEVSLP